MTKEEREAKRAASFAKEVARPEEMMRYEREYASAGHIAGIDEVGRGPLAGPVMACCVILPEDHPIYHLNDSKKLSEAKRETLYGLIYEKALFIGCAMVFHDVIDEINILNATYKAMNDAIFNLGIVPDIAFIDGNRSAGITYNNICIVGGDSRSASVAAASIIAKVTRDHYMYEMAEKYPEYMFDKHKGYGTKLHYEMLRRFGPCEIHRKTFLRKMH